MLALLLVVIALLVSVGGVTTTNDGPAVAATPVGSVAIGHGARPDGIGSVVQFLDRDHSITVGRPDSPVVFGLVRQSFDRNGSVALGSLTAL
jgi:hypothetical protein